MIIKKLWKNLIQYKLSEKKMKCPECGKKMESNLDKKLPLWVCYACEYWDFK